MINNPVIITLSEAERKRRMEHKAQQLYYAYLLTVAYELGELREILNKLIDERTGDNDHKRAGS